MGYRIALNFEDGAKRFIDCNAGEKVLDAAFSGKVSATLLDFIELVLTKRRAVDLCRVAGCFCCCRSC